MSRKDDFKRNKKQKKGNFWRDGLSIDETKFSLLMFMLLIIFIYSMYTHFTTGDITDNLVKLIEGLLLAVVGINGVSAISNAVSRREDNKHQGGDDENVF